MSGTQKKVLLYSETHNATSHPLEDRDKERTNKTEEMTTYEDIKWSSLGFRGGFPRITLSVADLVDRDRDQRIFQFTSQGE